MAGHKHAAAMADYAKDAAETERPWERWEGLGAFGEWEIMLHNPGWHANEQYRRKPRTLTIAGKDVQAPIITAEVGQRVHATGAAGDVVSMTFVDTHAHYDALANGRLFATPEAAKAAYDAITALLTGKDAA